MRFNLYTLRAVLTIAAFGCVAHLATTARAMNVYNDTALQAQLPVSFVCGLFCGNDWMISAGDMRSRPNTSGYIFASAPSYGGTYGCSVDVDKHGWVTATGSDERSILLTSYHQDGSVRTTCTFGPD